MKLSVFGATGEAGQQIIAQALAAGDRVVAYARNPAKLKVAHERLMVVQGELTDEAKIEQAVSGAHAVISVLGPRGDSRGKPITRGMKNILAAMRKQRVRRLIINSTVSARDPHDSFDLRFKALVILVKVTMRPACEEIASVAETVRNSDRDWTIVRVPMLNNNPWSGQVRVGYLGKGRLGVWLSRADMAAFMLQQVQDTSYLRQAPVISN